MNQTLKSTKQSTATASSAADDGRKHVIAVRLDPDIYAQVCQAAKDDSRTVASWTRAAVLKELGGDLNPARRPAKLAQGDDPIPAMKSALNEINGSQTTAEAK